MIKCVWIKLALYIALAMVPVFISFLAEFIEGWRADSSFALRIPWWVWLWVSLQAIYQGLLAWRTFIDSSYARHLEETKANEPNEKPTP